MGLSRLLILGLVVWAGLVLWRRYRGVGEPPRTETPAKRMVQCRSCRVYLPESEALHTAEGYTCRSHAQSDPRR